MKHENSITPIEMEHVTIFEQLKKEHDDLLELMKKTESCDTRSRKNMLGVIAKALLPHTRAEEKTLYSLMRLRAQKQNSKAYSLEIVNEGYEEHRAVDDLINSLKKISANNERWLPLFKVFKANIIHHIAKEEQTLWKEAQSVFSLSEQQELLRAYIIIKEKYTNDMPHQKDIREREPSAEVFAML